MKHPTSTPTRGHPASTTLYRPTIVDTTNRPHVRTFVGTPQKSAGRAKAIARDILAGQEEITQQNASK